MEVVFLVSAYRKNQYPPPDKPEVAFAGRSNVGKSALINVLVDRKGIARMSSHPGRTKSVNFFQVDNRLYFVDLPGYGYARVPVKIKRAWRRMVETYLRTRSNLKAMLLLLDIRRDPSPGDLDLLLWLEHFGIPSLVVLTKADKVSRQQAYHRGRKIDQQLGHMVYKIPILFSAKTKQGRGEIWEEINRLIEV